MRYPNGMFGSAMWRDCSCVDRAAPNLSPPTETNAPTGPPGPIGAFKLQVDALAEEVAEALDPLDALDVACPLCGGAFDAAVDDERAGFPQMLGNKRPWSDSRNLPTQVSFDSCEAA